MAKDNNLTESSSEDFSIENTTFLCYTGHSPEIVIPDFITHIYQYAFAQIFFIKSITLPNGVTSIGKSAFRECRFTNIAIPSSVTHIGESAFFQCLKLTSITIPDGISRIDNYTFCSCCRLESITIPSSVTCIGEWALNDCRALKSINFKGTKEQWNAIKKGKDWDGDTGKYVVHCIDGDVEKNV